VKYRWLLLPAAGIAVVVLGVLLFGNLNDNLVYYLTPSEALGRRADFPDGNRFRLGGLVERGSLRQEAGGMRFTVTDGDHSIPVIHQGTPSQLFQEDIGVIVEGSWAGAVFRSDTMLVKHDENYRPPPDQPGPVPAAGVGAVR
jgi:cytochrome c-type biogenesis protein CcmE